MKVASRYPCSAGRPGYDREKATEDVRLFSEQASEAPSSVQGPPGSFARGAASGGRRYRNLVRTPGTRGSDWAIRNVLIANAGEGALRLRSCPARLLSIVA